MSRYFEILIPGRPRRGRHACLSFAPLFNVCWNVGALSLLTGFVFNFERFGDGGGMGLWLFLTDFGLLLVVL